MKERRLSAWLPHILLEQMKMVYPAHNKGSLAQEAGLHESKVVTVASVHVGN